MLLCGGGCSPKVSECNIKVGMLSKVKGCAPTSRSGYVINASEPTVVCSLSISISSGYLFESALTVCFVSVNLSKHPLKIFGITNFESQFSITGNFLRTLGVFVPF